MANYNPISDNELVAARSKLSIRNEVYRAISAASELNTWMYFNGHEKCSNYMWFDDLGWTPCDAGIMEEMKNGTFI